MFARIFSLVLVASACSDTEDMHDSPDANQDDGTRPALEPNDVSILLSLPRSPAEMASHLYLLPSTIFPAGLEDELPSLFSTAPGTPSQLYRSMQVTAFRFVPCAPADSACRPQIRLVAQFVAPLAGGDYAMDEVALHLFYDLDPGEPAQIARSLRDLKALSPVSTTDAPLFVHPVLVDGGMGSAWGAQLRALIEQHARADRLVRVTSMGFVFDSWPFRDSKIANGHVVEETPLRHLAEPDVVQSWDIFGDADRSGNLRPASTVETGPAFLAVRSNFLDGSGAPKNTAEVRAAVDSLARTSNPTSHTPESVDCGSCHIARFIKHRAVAAGLDVTSTEAYRAPSWANTTRAQDPRIEGAAANIVQFGYFLRQASNEGLPESAPLPSVGERVIYESIEAAKLASALL